MDKHELTTSARFVFLLMCVRERSYRELIPCKIARGSQVGGRSMVVLFQFRARSYVRAGSAARATSRCVIIADRANCFVSQVTRVEPAPFDTQSCTSPSHTVMS
jgi:hypothetical protein